MLDHYLTGEVSRISPEAPVPVVRLRPSGETWIPGGASNAARNILSLGGSACIAGLIGSDSGAGVLRKLLDDDGVDTSLLITDPRRPTTTKTRVVAQSQQLMRLDDEVTSTPSKEVRSSLRGGVLEALPRYDAVVFADYEKGVVDAALAKEVTASARRLGIPVVVDPKEVNFFAYAGCTLFKPNRRETERALGLRIEGPDSAAEACGALLSRLECDAVLITLGSSGSMLCRPGEAPRVWPTAAHHVYDVSGAGDTVAAVMALGLGSGVSLSDCARMANFAAAAVCAEPGVYAVTADDVAAEIRAYRSRTGDAQLD